MKIKFKVIQYNLNIIERNPGKKKKEKEEIVIQNSIKYIFWLHVLVL